MFPSHTPMATKGKLTRDITTVAMVAPTIVNPTISTAEPYLALTMTPTTPTLMMKRTMNRDLRTRLYTAS